MSQHDRAYINARLLDPASELDCLGTLLVKDGKIVALGGDVVLPDNIGTQDCTGLVILPALWTQVFTGEPGAGKTWRPPPMRQRQAALLIWSSCPIPTR